MEGDAIIKDKNHKADKKHRECLKTGSGNDSFTGRKMMSTDRRRFRRFDVALDVEYKVSHSEDTRLSGKTINFSRTGLCFESDCFDPCLRDNMELKVKMPSTDEFASVTGNIAWKEQVHDKCYVGLEFMEIDREYKADILDYAYDTWLQKEKTLVPES